MIWQIWEYIMWWKGLQKFNWRIKASMTWWWGWLEKHIRSTIESHKGRPKKTELSLQVGREKKKKNLIMTAMCQWTIHPKIEHNNSHKLRWELEFSHKRVWSQILTSYNYWECIHRHSNSHNLKWVLKLPHKKTWFQVLTCYNHGECIGTTIHTISSGCWNFQPRGHCWKYP